MKKILVFIAAIISIASFGQARFVQQIDHTTHFGCNLQISPASAECDGVDSLHQKYIRHTLNMSNYVAGSQDAGLETRYSRGFRILLNVEWGSSGAGGRTFPTGADLTTFRNKLGAYLRTASGSGYFYFQAIDVVVVENEPFNQNYYDYSKTSVKAYLSEVEAAIDSCHRYGVKVSDGASHLAYYPSISNGNEGAGTPQRYADSAFRKYPNSYNAIQLDYVNWHTNVPFSPLSSNDSTMNPGYLAKWVDSLRSWTGHSNIINNEFHQEPEECGNCSPSTNRQQDLLCASLVTELRKCRLVITLNFGGDQDGATGCTNEIQNRAIQLVNNTPNNLQLCHLGTAYRDAVEVIQ